jgi:hypothetical protein
MSVIVHNIIINFFSFVWKKSQTIHDAPPLNTSNDVACVSINKINQLYQNKTKYTSKHILHPKKTKIDMHYLDFKYIHLKL